MDFANAIDGKVHQSLAKASSVINALYPVFHALDISTGIQGERLVADFLEEKSQGRSRTICRTVPGEHQDRVPISAAVSRINRPSPVTS